METVMSWGVMEIPVRLNGQFLETDELCPHYQKFATPCALMGMLLPSQTVNRYICSSLFRFLLQFVIH